jgi:hypothetical protein
VQQNHAGSAAACRFFVFVSPATVVGECPCAKKIWLRGGRRRIVHQHHEDLAAIVGVAFVIVPLLLGSINAVTDKNQIGIDVDSSVCAPVNATKSSANLKLSLPLAPEIVKRRRRICFYTDERHRLKETAILAGALSPSASKLRRDVLRRKLTTARACTASFEHVVRKKLDVSF